MLEQQFKHGSRYVVCAEMSAIQKIRLSFGRIFLVLIFFWLFVCLFVILPRFNDSYYAVSEPNEQFFIDKLDTIEKSAIESANLIDVLQHLLEELSSDNVNKDKLLQLRIRLNQSKKKTHESNEINEKIVPQSEYELTRRRIGQNVKELWYLMDAVLSLDPNTVKDSRTIRNLINEQKNYLLSDIDSLKSIDQYETWRRRESADLTNLVQRRLQFLQNPKDCRAAKKLKCNLNKACGYGCQIHHVVYCFIVAYATKRTMILDSVAWRYHRQGWNGIFQPISNTCTTLDAGHYISWPADDSNDVVSLPIIDSIRPKPKFLPLIVPEDLAPRLKRLHGNPIIWWIGQFLKFSLKPVPEIQQYLNESLAHVGFKKPIVGIHVRRTDKIGSEASYHKVEEYMKEADYYYQQLELSQVVDKRRVFIATDDPKVLDEARLKFANYQILGNSDIAQSAAISSRYTDNSLKGIIFDIHALSLSDYLVCTFSSQVCRLAYELMQTYHVDASAKFRSLDDIYYYGGQNDHNLVAVLPHTASSSAEIDLEVGDLIGIEGNHWDGYSKGLNRRLNKAGLFPSFKVADRIETYPFPTYPEIGED